MHTGRLLLRKAVTADLPAIHAILSDSAATAYWSTPPHLTLDQSRDWLQSMIDIDPTQGDDFIVEHQGRVIGKAGLYRFPEIGFIFHPEVWGQGFAAEALAAVFDRAFETHRLPAIEADVDPGNMRSLKLLRGLGFRDVGRQERTWFVGDRWCDSIYLRLEPESWTVRKPRPLR